MANEWNVEANDNPLKPWRVVGTGLWANPRTGQPVRRWVFAYKTEDAAKAALVLLPEEHRRFEVKEG